MSELSRTMSTKTAASVSVAAVGCTLCALVPSIVLGLMAVSRSSEISNPETCE